jgi:hypothetical protein
MRVYHEARPIAVLQWAFSSSIAALLSQKAAYAILSAATVLIAIALLATSKVGAPAIMISWNLAGIVGQPFAIAAAIRFSKPDFRMTAARLIVGLAISLAFGLIVGAGLYALIIPGVWLGTKLSLWFTLYELGVSNPMRTSWHLTGGAFWKTLLLFAALIVFGYITILIVAMGGTLVASGVPALAIVCAPLVFLYYVWFFGLSQLVWARWSSELLIHSEAYEVAHAHDVKAY